ncbi:ASB3 [Symbiodinium sp. CCMP2456]|nr:ASB3 [Symbiodinium sp. CCMP2456]
MADEVDEIRATVDEAWLAAWGNMLGQHLSGLNTEATATGVIGVDSQDAGVNVSDAGAVDRHVAMEHEETERSQQEEAARAEEAEFYRREEECLLRYQAAAYQAWEDWELNNAMQQDAGQPPLPRRKRCVVEIEVSSGSQDGPRSTRRQVFDIPPEGRLRLQLSASMVDDIPESDISTVVLEPAVTSANVHFGGLQSGLGEASDNGEVEPGVEPIGVQSSVVEAGENGDASEVGLNAD